MRPRYCREGGGKLEKKASVFYLLVERVIFVIVSVCHQNVYGAFDLATY